MLKRILELPEERRKNTTSLARGHGPRGSARCRPTWPRTPWMSSATTSSTLSLHRVAWPHSPHPRTCGRARHRATAAGSVVHLYDEGDANAQGRDRARLPGERDVFAGYSGGGTKDMIDGPMATGDVGRFDPKGRLFVEGRDDEMIVSGGENVFPDEVEDRSCATPSGARRPDRRRGPGLWPAAPGVHGADQLGDHRGRAEGQRQAHLARYKVRARSSSWTSSPNANGKVLKRELKSRASADQVGCARCHIQSGRGHSST